MQGLMMSHWKAIITFHMAGCYEKKKKLDQMDLDLIQQGQLYPKTANASIYLISNSSYSHTMNSGAYLARLEAPFADWMNESKIHHIKKKKKEFISKTNPVEYYDTFDIAAFFFH